MDAVSAQAELPTGTVELREMDLNLVVLCGQLTSDPVIRRFDTGATQLTMLIGVRAPIPSSRIDVLPVVYWKPPASLLDGSLRADTRVWVSGTLRRKDPDSLDRLEVVAASLSVRGSNGELVHA